MIKILLQFFSGICITDADCLFQIGFLKCHTEVFQFFHVFSVSPLNHSRICWIKFHCISLFGITSSVKYPVCALRCVRYPVVKRILHRLSESESNIPVSQFLTEHFFMLFPSISCSISFLSAVFALLKNFLIISLLLVFTQ